MSPVFYRAPALPPPVIDRGEGVYLWDRTGKRYLDGSSGALVANLGHGRREIAQAMARQAERVAFAHTQRFTSEAQEELARRLAAFLPYGLAYTYPVSGGSEATETAVKMARQYHLERGDRARTRVIARWGSYHGNSLGALAASGHHGRRLPYAPLLSDAFLHVHPSGGACGGPDASGRCPCLDALEEIVRGVGPETVAAILLEPVVGSADSARVPHPGYLEGVRALADAHGILLIADEVMTGLGRTGRRLGVEHMGVAPDLVTVAKGLSGGYAPLGAVVATAKVHETFLQGSGRFAHGFTYGGHPVACAAGAKAMEILVREDLVARAEEMGIVLRRGLLDLGARFQGAVSEVRGVGLMQGLVLPTDTRRPGGRAARLAEIAFGKGLIIYPGSGGPDGPFGDHVLVAPPLVVTKEEIDELLELLEASLAELG